MKTANLIRIRMRQ